jgi:hypothetical protein
MYFSWIVGLVDTASVFAYLLPKKVSSMVEVGMDKKLFEFYAVDQMPQGSA